MELKIGEVLVRDDEVSAEDWSALEQFVENGVMNDRVVGILSALMVTKRKENGTADGESKSSKMVKMYEAGLTKGEIAKLLGVRYNFVFNVISKYEDRKERTAKSATRK